MEAMDSRGPVNVIIMAHICSPQKRRDSQECSVSPPPLFPEEEEAYPFTPSPPPWSYLLFLLPVVASSGIHFRFIREPIRTLISYTEWGLKISNPGFCTTSLPWLSPSSNPLLFPAFPFPPLTLELEWNPHLHRPEETSSSRRLLLPPLSLLCFWGFLWLLCCLGPSLLSLGSCWYLLWLGWLWFSTSSRLFPICPNWVVPFSYPPASPRDFHGQLSFTLNNLDG